MSYVVLARRYRPQIFADLVGQEHVSVTLKNAILQKRTAHAYLFTGPRGVGKTSAARILARALRCLEPSQDGEPCNKCVACAGALDGSSMDILEIDAASNTGVDNIRDLRENVEYMASVGKYRIYIIDEVHMLSTAAFNALLKTLEEPPPHVVFIFATTELHKVLPTIQSRCQRFDFKKIPHTVMIEKLQSICEAEGVAIDSASVRTLAVESEGCMRDAESLLDQAITLCGKNITIATLESALSLLDRTNFLSLLRSIGAHDAGAALKLCSAMANKGVDSKILLNRLVDFYSDLHYRAFTGESRVPDPDLDAVMIELVKALSPDEIVRGLDLGLRTQTTLSQSLNSAMSVESFIVKLCLQRPAAVGAYASDAATPAARAQAASPQHLSPPPYQSPAPQASVSQTQVRAAPSSASIPSSPRAPTPVPSHLAVPAAPLAIALGDLGPLETYVRAAKPAWTPVLQSVLGLEHENGILKVRVKNDFAGKRLASNDGIEVLKLAYKVAKAVVIIEAAAVPMGPQFTPQEKAQQKHTMAKEHDAVKSALKIFEATITETKVLDDENNPKGAN